MALTVPRLYRYLNARDMAVLSSVNTTLNPNQEMIYQSAVSNGIPYWEGMSIYELNELYEMDLPELLEAAVRLSDKHVLSYWLDDVKVDNLDSDIVHGISRVIGAALEMGDIELYNSMMSRFNRVDLGGFHVQAVKSGDLKIILLYVQDAVDLYMAPARRSQGYNMLLPMLDAAIEVGDMDLIDTILNKGSGTVWNKYADNYDDDHWVKDTYLEDGSVVSTDYYYLEPYPYKHIFDVAYSCATFEEGSDEPDSTYADIITKIIMRNQEAMQEERDEVEPGNWRFEPDIPGDDDDDEYSEYPDFSYHEIDMDRRTVIEIAKRNNISALSNITDFTYGHDNPLVVALEYNSIDVADELLNKGLEIRDFSGKVLKYITSSTLEYIVDVIGVPIDKHTLVFGEDPNVARLMISYDLLTCNEWTKQYMGWLDSHLSRYLYNFGNTPHIIILKFLIEECEADFSLVNKTIERLRELNLLIRASKVAKYFGLD